MDYHMPFLLDMELVMELLNLLLEADLGNLNLLILLINYPYNQGTPSTEIWKGQDWLYFPSKSENSLFVALIFL